MPGRLALKRLKTSDLTYFEFQHRNHSQGNQKAISLHAYILAGTFYPALAQGVQPPEPKLRFPVDVYMYGPGLAEEYHVQRPLLKQTKNWRLNGETVKNPDNEPNRFDILAPNDLALFEFNEGISPQALSIDFVSASLWEDSALHAALERLLPPKTSTVSMIEVTIQQLQAVIHGISIDKNHPVIRFIADTELQTFAQGSESVIESVLAHAPDRKVSAADLKKAKDAATRIGDDGERIVYRYLRQRKASGRIADFEWASRLNAISPYDFSLTPEGETRVLIDVKSTELGHDRVFHISYGELRMMAEGQDRYDIYRVSSMGESHAVLRIAENVRAFAVEVLSTFKHLPDGVTADGISVSPDNLPFGDPIELSLPEASNDGSTDDRDE